MLLEKALFAHNHVVARFAYTEKGLHQPFSCVCVCVCVCERVSACVCVFLLFLSPDCAHHKRHRHHHLLLLLLLLLPVHIMTHAMVVVWPCVASFHNPIDLSYPLFFFPLIPITPIAVDGLFASFFTLVCQLTAMLGF